MQSIVQHKEAKDSANAEKGKQLGYKCCHQTVGMSYCLGQAGHEAVEAAGLRCSCLSSG